MKARLLIVIAFVGFCLGGTSVLADTYPVYSPTFGAGNGATLQAVLDAPVVDLDGDGDLDGILVTGPSYPSSSVNVTSMAMLDDYDSYWSIDAAGGSIETIIIEIASYAGSNVFGIYDKADPMNSVQLFGGGAGAGDQVLVTIKADGSVFLNATNDTGKDFAANLFGFYLVSPDGTFYSDTDLNIADKVDHMYAYQGTGQDKVQLPGLAAGWWTDNQFILAWEDLINGGDADYTDFVVMIESITPVPVPAAVLLGMLGLGAAGIRLRKHV